MQTLRRAHWLHQLVLAWFALFIGASAASSVIRPDAMHLLCTAGGMKMVMVDSEGQITEPSPSGMDCPLCCCGPTPLPSPGQQALPLAPQACAAVLPPEAAPATFSPQARPPLPPRGPPQSLL